MTTTDAFMTTTDALGTAAQVATARYTEARERYALLTGEVLDLEAQRPLEKDAAIRQAMTAAESRGEKLAYTAAERTVEAEASYAAHCKRLRETIARRELAYGQAEAARQQHATALALLTLAPREQEVEA